MKITLLSRKWAGGSLMRPIIGQRGAGGQFGQAG
jgi:hypothetical protein